MVAQGPNFPHRETAIQRHLSQVRANPVYVAAHVAWPDNIKNGILARLNEHTVIEFQEITQGIARDALRHRQFHTDIHSMDDRAENKLLTKHIGKITGFIAKHSDSLATYDSSPVQDAFDIVKAVVDKAKMISDSVGKSASTGIN